MNRHILRLWAGAVAALLSLTLGGVHTAAAQEGTVGGDTTGTITIHVMQEGETLDSVAADYNVSVDALRRVNSLSAYDSGSVGQRLIIPAGADDRFNTGSTAIIAGLSDTLYGIAARHALDVSQLGRMNRIANPANLTAGQVIYLPDSTSGSVVVRAEDGLSLWRLALAENKSILALMAENGISSPALVQAGYPLLASDAEGAPDLLPAPFHTLALHPLPIEVGRTGSLLVELDQPGTLTANFLDTDWPTITDGDRYRVLLPIDRWTSSGVYPLTLTFTGEDGTTATYTRQVTVIDGSYAAEELRLSEEVATKLDNQADVAAEIAWVNATMSGVNAERRWAEGPFLLPAAGVLTSGYGTLRAYTDGIFNQFHTGADLAGPTGTPIYAPADGVVVDSGLLDVRGYVTIIDHGWGVYTGYWHQSSILVNPGDEVEAGQQIGTIGSTGLSTAAHLHWEMHVNGVQVDPMQWVRESLP